MSGRALRETDEKNNLVHATLLLQDVSERISTRQSQTRLSEAAAVGLRHQGILGRT